MIGSLKHRIQNQTEDLFFFLKGVEPFSNTKKILIDIDFQKYLENGHYNEVRSFLNLKNFSKRHKEYQDSDLVQHYLL